MPRIYCMTEIKNMVCDKVINHVCKRFTDIEDIILKESHNCACDQVWNQVIYQITAEVYGQTDLVLSPLIDQIDGHIKSIYE